MSRVNIFLLLIAAAAGWAGSQAIYVGFINQKPTTMTMSEFIKKKPSATWLTLTGGRYKLSGALYSYKKDKSKIQDLYIPYVSIKAGDPASYLFVKTDDKKLKAAFALYNKGTKDKILVKSVLTKWAAKRKISGLVQFGIDSDSDFEKKIQKLAGAKNTITVLELNKKPLGIIIGILILAGAFVALFFAFRKKAA